MLADQTSMQIQTKNDCIQDTSFTGISSILFNISAFQEMASICSTVSGLALPCSCPVYGLALLSYKSRNKNSWHSCVSPI